MVLVGGLEFLLLLPALACDICTLFPYYQPSLRNILSGVFTINFEFAKLAIGSSMKWCLFYLTIS